jgi:LysM repeat protein
MRFTQKIVMSTSNPPGSTFEKVAQKKNNLPVLVIILLGVHLVAAAGLLWSGCKPQPEQQAEANPPTLPPLGNTNSPTDSLFFQPLDQADATSTATVPPTGPGIVAEQRPVISQDIAPLPGPSTGMPDPAADPAPPGGRVPHITPPTVRAGTGASATAVSTAAPSASRTHTIGRGDTFYSIANEYGTTMSAIQAANPTIDARKLRLGQKVSVPPAPAAARQVQSNDSSVYVVKSGDMLGKIAQKFKTTVKRLREVNNLPSDRIRVGQKLKLPTEALR